MQEKRKVDVSSYINYMKFMAKNLDAVKALEIYSSIQDESIKKNVFLCNCILTCLVRKHKYDMSIKLFKRMKEDGLVPDLVTYTTVSILTLTFGCDLNLFDKELHLFSISLTW